MLLLSCFLCDPHSTSPPTPLACRARVARVRQFLERATGEGEALEGGKQCAAAADGEHVAPAVPIEERLKEGRVELHVKGVAEEERIVAGAVEHRGGVL